MPAGPVPDNLLPLLQSDNVGMLSTLGRHGEPHTTPIWFLWNGNEVLISLFKGTQKERNLRRDPRVSIAIADRTNQTFYLEVRGTVSFAVDHDEAVFAAISRKYTGHVHSLEPEGTVRFVARFAPRYYTFQNALDLPAPEPS